MKLTLYTSAPELCNNIVPPAKKGLEPIVCVNTNDWTVEKSESGYGLLFRCNVCAGLKRYFGHILKDDMIVRDI